MTLSRKSEYFIWVCPECGEQEDLYAPRNHPATYCLNHENDVGRATRPAHIRIGVKPDGWVRRPERGPELNSEVGQ